MQLERGRMSCVAVAVFFEGATDISQTIASLNMLLLQHYLSDHVLIVRGCCKSVLPDVQISVHVPNFVKTQSFYV